MDCANKNKKKNIKHFNSNTYNRKWGNIEWYMKFRKENTRLHRCNSKTRKENGFEDVRFYDSWGLSLQVLTVAPKAISIGAGAAIRSLLNRR